MQHKTAIHRTRELKHVANKKQEIQIKYKKDFINFNLISRKHNNFVLKLRQALKSISNAMSRLKFTKNLTLPSDV